VVVAASRWDGDRFPLPATQKSRRRVFGKTHFGKALAWALRNQDQELMFLELSCRVDFLRGVL
jgi:hypothetical protein